MFTGLIECVGEVAAIREYEELRRLRIAATAEFLGDAVIGESIAINGVCLTVVELETEYFEAEAVPETLRRTSLRNLSENSKVNLERALKANARLGGHIVQGHVDGVGAIVSVREEGDSWWTTIEPPFELMKYIVEKGSVCIDGISLTVANVAYNRFSVALIPHTRTATNAQFWQPDSAVNIEVDIVAKYVERMTTWQHSEPQPA